MKQIGEEIIGGWPIYAFTLREILVELGFKENEPGLFQWVDDPEILDAYPITLEDDGMGYGVNGQYITEVSSEIYKDESLKESVFNLFRDGNRQIDKISNT